MPTNTAHRTLLAAALIVVALLPSAWLAWQWREMPYLGLYHDDALYLVGAKSIAEGNGYRVASLPGAPYQTKYPPLYSALVSVIWRVDPNFPGNLPKVMLLTWAFFVAAVFLARALLKQCGASDPESLAIAALVALSPVAVHMSLMAMSELPFCAFVFAALLAAERGRAGWAGLCGGLAFLTRGAALPLLLTVPAVYLWRNRDLARAGRFAAGMAPAVIFWQAWTAMHRAPAGPLTLYYTDYLAFHRFDVPLEGWPRMIADNANLAIKSIGELLVFDQDPGFAALTLARLLAVATISGCIRLVRAGRFVHFCCFAVLYLVQLLMWNYPPGQRFLLPLLPLILAGFWRELEALQGIIAAAYRKRGADRGVAIAICCLLAWLGITAFRYSSDGLFNLLPSVLAQGKSVQAEDRAASQWLEKNAGPDAVLLSFRDPVDYLYTGRRGYSLRVPPSVLKRGDTAELRRFFAPLPDLVERHSIGYVVLTSADYRGDRPDLTVPNYRAVFKDPNRFELAFEQGGAKIYRVKPATQGAQARRW